MTLKDLDDRISEGEVVPVALINGISPDHFINRNWNHFQHLTIENDYEKADIFWIYDKRIREQQEYNP